MTDPGQRHHLLTFQRATVAPDDYGGEDKTWHEITTAWALIRYGTGQERREAAQEAAVQAITAECDWAPTLAAVVATDRFILFETAWDITSKAIIGANKEVHFTAVANPEAPIDS